MTVLPCTPDLSETGVAEVVRALAHPSRQLFLNSYDEMRLGGAENIASLGCCSAIWRLKISPLR